MVRLLQDWGESGAIAFQIRGKAPSHPSSGRPVDQQKKRKSQSGKGGNVFSKGSLVILLTGKSRGAGREVPDSSLIRNHWVWGEKKRDDSRHPKP